MKKLIIIFLLVGCNNIEPMNQIKVQTRNKIEEELIQHVIKMKPNLWTRFNSDSFILPSLGPSIVITCGGYMLFSSESGEYEHVLENSSKRIKTFANKLGKLYPFPKPTKKEALKFIKSFEEKQHVIKRK